MKRLKKMLDKVIGALMIIIVPLGMGGVLQNVVMANSYLIDTTYLYKKHELDECIKYKNMPFGIKHIEYEKDGVKYPAYGMNNRTMGITAREKLEVVVTGRLENNIVYKVIKNGDSFFKPSDLTYDEVHAATQLAIFNVTSEPDMYRFEDFTVMNEQGERILQAAKDIVQKAKNSDEEVLIGEATVIPITEEWQKDEMDGTYFSKIYRVDTNAEALGYVVELNELNATENVKIVDVNNEEKTNFSAGEKFKVLVPKAQVKTAREGTNKEISIVVKADLRTKPILITKSDVASYQDYVVLAGEWEHVEATFKQAYPELNKNEETPKVDEGNKDVIGNIGTNISESVGGNVGGSVIETPKNPVEGDASVGGAPQVPVEGDVSVEGTLKEPVQGDTDVGEVPKDTTNETSKVPTQGDANNDGTDIKKGELKNDGRQPVKPEQDSNKGQQTGKTTNKTTAQTTSKTVGQITNQTTNKTKKKTTAVLPRTGF